MGRVVGGWGRKPLPNLCQKLSPATFRGKPLPGDSLEGLSRRPLPGASAGNLSRDLFRKPLPGVFATSGYAKNRRCANTLCSRNRQTHPTPSHRGFAFWLNLPLEIGHCWVPGGVRVGGVGWGRGLVGGGSLCRNLCLMFLPTAFSGRLSREAFPENLSREPLPETSFGKPLPEPLPGVLAGSLPRKPLPGTNAGNFSRNLHRRPCDSGEEVGAEGRPTTPPTYFM